MAKVGRGFDEHSLISNLCRGTESKMCWNGNGRHKSEINIRNCWTLGALKHLDEAVTINCVSKRSR